MTMPNAQKLPKSRVYEPWTLVYSEGPFKGPLKLAFVVSFFGGGPVASQFTGGRGHLAEDDGRLPENIGEPIAFAATQFVYSWRIRPTLRQLEGARLKEQPTQLLFAS